MFHFFIGLMAFCYQPRSIIGCIVIGREKWDGMDIIQIIGGLLVSYATEGVHLKIRPIGLTSTLVKSLLRTFLKNQIHNTLHKNFEQLKPQGLSCHNDTQKRFVVIRFSEKINPIQIPFEFNAPSNGSWDSLDKQCPI